MSGCGVEEWFIGVPAAVAQTPVTWDAERNLAVIAELLADARPGEVMVFPEAVVSGYDDKLPRLDQLDPDALARSVDRAAALARGKNIRLFCGSLLPLTATSPSTVTACVEKGRGPDGPIAADIQALCPARLGGGDRRASADASSGGGRACRLRGRPARPGRKEDAVAVRVSLRRAAADGLKLNDVA